MTYFVGLTPLAVVVTSLVALWLTPTPAATLGCLFVYHEHTAIGGDLTVSISGVTTLVECQAFLKDRSSRFAAVTYNDAKRECCGVLLGVNLSLQYEFGSTTLTFKSGATLPDTNHSTSIVATTTRATTHDWEDETTTSVDYVTSNVAEEDTTRLVTQDWEDETTTSVDYVTSNVAEEDTTRLVTQDWEDETTTFADYVTSDVAEDTTRLVTQDWEDETTTSAEVETSTITPTIDGLRLIETTTVNNVTIASFITDERFNLTHISWMEAAVLCRSINWQLAQLTTDELLQAADALEFYYAWIGVYKGRWMVAQTAVAPEYTKTETDWTSKPFGLLERGKDIYGASDDTKIRRVFCTSE